eukprot:scaffold2566_cov33-Tisochrysis_lutea.AAC.2
MSGKRSRIHCPAPGAATRSCLSPRERSATPSAEVPSERKGECAEARAEREIEIPNTSVAAAGSALRYQAREGEG